MSEKIEQVAMKIQEAHALHGRSFTAMASAALKEIRIPTAAMMTAGSAAGRAHTTYVDNQSARIIFEAMINAALEEKP